MTERQTLALYLGLIVFGIAATVAQHYGYFPESSIDDIDKLATLGWALVPLFLCLVMFYVARFFKRLADKMEAQTWQIRTETKHYRRVHN
jgi:hypothetical protein